MGKPYRELLPLVEMDILHLIEDLKKSQSEAAKILGVSQPTVHYRLQKAKSRLRHKELLPTVTSAEVQEVMERLGCDSQDIKTMLLYLKYNSQSMVARDLGRSQGAVRHWLMRGISRLSKDRSQDPLHRNVRTACHMLVDNPNMFSPEKKEDISQVTRIVDELPAYDTKVLSGLYAGLPARVSENGTLTVKLRSCEIALTVGAS